jgi:hypothetical protein
LFELALAGLPRLRFGPPAALAVVAQASPAIMTTAADAAMSREVLLLRMTSPLRSRGMLGEVDAPVLELAQFLARS